MYVKKEYFEIVNDFEDIISGDLYVPVDIDKSIPLIIISHGFKGFKDWGFAPYLSESLAKHGNIVLCFNFSLNGKPDNNLIITKPEKFAKNTVTREINDLEYLVNSFLCESIDLFTSIKQFWNEKIFLLGHSLGGGISLITAYRNPLISKVAIWASIAKFDRYTERQKKEWKEKGFIEFTNQRTNQLLRMNLSYLNDIEHNKYNLPETLSHLKMPVLLIHGKQDVTVPLKEAKLLIDADKNKILTYEIIENTGHTFGIDHPFTKTNPALEKAIKLTSEFFKL